MHQHVKETKDPCWTCLGNGGHLHHWQPNIESARQQGKTAAVERHLAEYTAQHPEATIARVQGGQVTIEKPVLCEYCNKAAPILGLTACVKCREMELAIRNNPLAARKMLRQVTHELMDLGVDVRPHAELPAETSVRTLRDAPALEQDEARLDWLEETHTLHKSVEFTYVVDGFTAELLRDGTAIAEAHGETLRDALDKLKSRVAGNPALR